MIIRLDNTSLSTDIDRSPMRTRSRRGEACVEVDVRRGACVEPKAICGKQRRCMQQFNLTYMNDFIGCLCEGQTYTGALENETIAGSVGICESCQTTPALV